MTNEIFNRLEKILELLLKILFHLEQQKCTENDEWLDSAELKQRLKISDKTVYRMRKSGVVSAKQLSGKWYYKLPEFKREC